MPSFSESGKWEQNHPAQIAYSLDKTPPPKHIQNSQSSKTHPFHLQGV